MGPSAALNRNPTPVTSVNNTSQTIPQPSVSKQSTTFQPPHLVSRSGQLQGFSVKVAEKIAAPQRSSTIVLGIGLKNQNRLISNSKRSIINYNRFSACFVRKTEYSFFTKYNNSSPPIGQWRKNPGYDLPPGFSPGGRL